MLDNGKAYNEAYGIDLPLVIHCYRYYAGCMHAEDGGRMSFQLYVASSGHWTVFIFMEDLQHPMYIQRSKSLMVFEIAHGV